jgi:hypothetical protein
VTSAGEQLTVEAIGGTSGNGGANGTAGGTGGAIAVGSASGTGSGGGERSGSGGSSGAGVNAGTGGKSGETGNVGGATSGGSSQATGGGDGTGEGGGGPDGGGEIGGAPAVADCPDVGLDATVIHYVCDCLSGAAEGCAPGDDSASGALDAPWRTVQKAQQAFQSATAGTTVAFCRGGSFDASGGAWVNENTSDGCTAAEPCVVRDYAPPAGTGSEERPIFTVSSGHGIDLTNGGDAVHEEGYVFLNLDVRSTSGGSSGNGVFAYNDVDDVLVCNSSFEGFDVGFYMAGSNPAAAGSDGKNSRIELRGSQVKNCGSQGMLGSCDDCVLAYNEFENNGFGASSPDEGSRNHNVYLSAHTLVRGMKVVGNRLYRSAMVDGACTGAPLVVHGQLADLSIEGNRIEEDLGAAAPGCWGLSVDTGYAGEHEEFSNVTIRRNTVINTGNVGIGTSGCDTCTIENNLVIQGQAFSTTLIAVPVRDRGSEDQPLDAVTVRNNTLVDLSSASMTGVSLGGEGTGHTSSGNAILGDGGGTLSCFAYGLDHASYGLRDHNLCFVSAGTLRWAGGSALAAFQAASGVDGNSVSANPGFVSSSAPFDFHPAAGSPLIDSAGSASPADDLEGKTRDTNPDIGALER